MGLTFLFRAEESLCEPIFLLGTGVFLNSLNKSSVDSSKNLFWFIGLNSLVLDYYFSYIRIETFYFVFNCWTFVPFYQYHAISPTPQSLATTFLLFLWVWLFLKKLMYSFIYLFLDFTYKWYHAVFVFLCMASFT